MENNNLNKNLMMFDNINQIKINHNITTKNKWLYPTDEFGKMEKGIVYESLTYESGVNKNKINNQNFIIYKIKHAF